MTRPSEVTICDGGKVLKRLRDLAGMRFESYSKTPPQAHTEKSSENQSEREEDCPQSQNDQEKRSTPSSFEKES